MYIKPGFGESTSHHRKYAYKFNLNYLTRLSKQTVWYICIWSYKQIYVHFNSKRYMYRLKNAFISVRTYIYVSIQWIIAYPCKCLFHCFKSTFLLLSNVCYWLTIIHVIYIYYRTCLCARPCIHQKRQSNRESVYKVS